MIIVIVVDQVLFRFSLCIGLDPFRRYLRSKLKFVKKIAPNFGHFFRPKVVLYHARREARLMVIKFSEVTPTNRKVIGTHKLNFKLSFKCSSSKFFGGPLRPRL